MKKLLTESTFKRLIKTFINEDINKIKSGKLLAWVKNFNQKAGTSYDENFLANIVEEFLNYQSKGGLRINNKPVDMLAIRSDEQLKQVIAAIEERKTNDVVKNNLDFKSKSGAKIFSNKWSNLTAPQKFSLLKSNNYRFVQNPNELFPSQNNKYIPIPANEFRTIEETFQTNADRGSLMSYAVWFTLCCFKGYKKAEDAPIIKDFINIYLENKQSYPFEIDFNNLDITKILSKQEFDQFYKISSELKNQKSGANISTSGYVSEMVSKYPQFYQGDFSDQKYGQTYAYFQLPKISENEIPEYQQVFRDLGMWTTWCVSYGWDGSGDSNSDTIKRYATADKFSILINKADPKNSVNGKFAINSADQNMRNITDQGVF